MIKYFHKNQNKFIIKFKNNYDFDNIRINKFKKIFIYFMFQIFKNIYWFKVTFK